MGSWTFLIVLVVLLAAGVAATATLDGHAGLAAMFAMALSGLALVEISLVLMVARRADRTASEWALHDLDHERRLAALADELRDEVERLRADLAWHAARVETSNRWPR